MRTILLTLALIGCSPSGSVAVEGTPSDTTGSEDTTDTTDPSDTTDTTDTTDTEEKEEEEPDPFEAYAGEYEGLISMLMESEWFDYELEDCEAVIEVDEDGELSGEAACVLDYGGGWGANAWGGGGGDEEVPMFIEGEVDEDGEITGEIEVELSWGGLEIEPLEMVGETDGEEISLEFEGEVVTDWLTAEVYGDGELER